MTVIFSSHRIPEGRSMKRNISGSAALCLVLAACGANESIGPTTGELITLSAAQAAALVSKVESFGALDPNLASLSDTVEVVLKAGAEAKRIDVTTDLGSGPFWAVSLHMPNTISSPASSTFHVIAFNEPNNPTQFIILGGWAQGTGNNPPSTVNGSLSGPSATTSVTGHLFSVSGSQVSAWRATSGGSVLTSSATGQACTGFTGPGTCVRGAMDVSFSIAGTIPDAGSAATGQRTASGTITSIPGIRLSM
jgi:hypothetical protein